MANSRLEKVGTIYTRVTGLIKSGAMKWVDRPIWYDVYEAFPPKEEPKFDRPAPNMQIRKIFYEEDKIRAIFHRNNKHVGVTNLFNNESTTLTQKFVENYKKLKVQYNDDVTEEQLYKETIDLLQREKQTATTKEKDDEEEVNLSSSFKEAQSKLLEQHKIEIKLKEIFKN